MSKNDYNGRPWIDSVTFRPDIIPPHVRKRMEFDRARAEKGERRTAFQNHRRAKLSDDEFIEIDLAVEDGDE